MENNNGYNRAIKLVRYGDPITVMVLLNQLNLGPGSLHHKYGLSCVYWINSGQFAVSKWSIAIFTITQNESQQPTSSDLNYCLNIHLFDSTSSCESIPLVEQPVSPEGSSATLKDTPEFLQSNECLSLLIFLSSPSKLLTGAQARPLSLLQCHIVRVTPVQWCGLFLLKFPVSPPRVMLCVTSRTGTQPPRAKSASRTF